MRFGKPAFILSGGRRGAIKFGTRVFAWFLAGGTISAIGFWRDDRTW